MTRRRLLFVEDGAGAVDGSSCTGDVDRQRWELLFARSGEEALDLLATEPVDVVISDMRLPGLSGGELLAEVRQRHPEIARIILSAPADRDSIVTLIGPTQQFLAKPCATGVIRDAVERVRAVRDLVGDPRLRAVLGSVQALPKPPAVYDQLLLLAADPDCSIDDVVRVIEEDVGATAEVLHLVNSAFFGLSNPVPNVARAVVLLGLETVRSLTLAGAVFHPGPATPPGLDPRALSQRGLQVGVLARRLAQAEGWSTQDAGALFLAGLLHQAGLLVLAGAHPAGWQALRPAMSVWVDERDRLEREIFGCSVTEATAYLLGLWAFEETVVHAIAGQPAPPSDGVAPPAAHLLSVARRWCLAEPEEILPVDGGFLDASRLASWRKAAGLPSPAVSGA